MFSLPISLSPNHHRPYKTQIADQISALIQAGHLREGDKLPSIARLASLLNVSKNTILGAYDLLMEACLIDSLPSRGYYVTRPLEDARQADLALPEPASPLVYAPAVSHALSSGVYIERETACAPPCYDFKVGRPSVHAFPKRKFMALSNQLLQTCGCAMAEYTPPAGLWGLRVQIADYLSANKALVVKPEQIIITSGSQEALSLITSHFLDAQSTAVFESPCYAGFANLVKRHKARQAPIPVDAEGICTDLLPDTPASLAFVTPSHQYPLGVTMSVARRTALLAWAEATGALIIEDDYDGDFCYDSLLPRPLAAMHPHRVFYLGTFSKTLGPGLRLGYMVCPPTLAEDFIERKALLNHGAPWLNQAVLARYLDEGFFDRHLQHLRYRYQKQRDALIHGIHRVWGEDVLITGQNCGMHLAVELPEGSPCVERIAQQALDYGVKLYPLAQAAASDMQHARPRHLLFGYASLGVDEIATAMARVAQACRQLRATGAATEPDTVQEQPA